MIAQTPPPPYYAVIFTSLRTKADNGYSEMAAHMIEIATKQEGFLGVESAGETPGITVSYWRDLTSIQKWREHAEHTLAREKGKSDWYSAFTTRIARVERDYSFERNVH
jgi:heme-degrading monooxygenase HmoA